MLAQINAYGHTAQIEESGAVTINGVTLTREAATVLHILFSVHNVPTLLDQCEQELIETHNLLVLGSGAYVPADQIN